MTYFYTCLPYIEIFLIKKCHAFPNNTTQLETKNLYFIVVDAEYEEANMLWGNLLITPFIITYKISLQGTQDLFPWICDISFLWPMCPLWKCCSGYRLEREKTCKPSNGNAQGEMSHAKTSYHIDGCSCPCKLHVCQRNGFLSM